VRFATKIATVAFVAVVLAVSLRSQTRPPITPAEEGAHRSWATERAGKRMRGWGRCDGVAQTVANARNFALEPYADPNLYAPGSTVLQPGASWSNTVTLSLPVASAAGASPAVGRYQRDPRIRVLRNEWLEHGVEVIVDDVRVESYVYATWRVRVRFTINVANDAALGCDDPARAGEVSIASGVGGTTYRCYLIHQPGHAGLAVRESYR
jgi:hypothetical protein